MVSCKTTTSCFVILVRITNPDELAASLRLVRSFDILYFNIWNLFVIWLLLFGISNPRFPPKNPLLPFSIRRSCAQASRNGGVRAGWMTKGIQHRAKALAFRLQTVRRVCAWAFECDPFAGDVAFCQSSRKHSFQVAFFGSFLFDKRNEVPKMPKVWSA